MIDPKHFVPNENPENGGYVYNPELSRAIRVALATNRPLLLRGSPGNGKSTLARDLAKTLRGTLVDYYEEVVTSRTEARDLEWRFDSVLRLAEAQVGATRKRVERAANYIEPRALWWGFDPANAKMRGGEADTPAKDPLEATGGSDPSRSAIVLIDEIDKAEPEVANDLLEPFDVRTFTVAETGTTVSCRRDVFLIVTTNDERDLPAAFLRRCVVHSLRRPKRNILKAIAASHFAGRVSETDVDQMIDRVEALAAEAAALKLRQPGTAEFIDALRACMTLKPDKAEWTEITRLALWKHPAEEKNA